MPKVKTNSGAKKRFRFTGTGKIKRHHAYHSHILTKKTKKQKRNLLGETRRSFKSEAGTRLALPSLIINFLVELLKKENYAKISKSRCI